MSSAAQPIEPQRLVGSPHRTAAVLRHLALRGAAIIYLGLLVALPIAAVITKGFGDGLGDVHARRWTSPGRGRRSG